MRKYSIVIILSLFALSGCNKNPGFTKKQVNAFFILAGNFQAYSQDAVIVGVISFKERYSAPTELSGRNVYAHGECAFSDARYEIPEQGYISCYYALSDDADQIHLYYRGGSNNKKKMRTYGLTIQGNDTLHLTEEGQTLIFERIIL